VVWPGGISRSINQTIISYLIRRHAQIEGQVGVDEVLLASLQIASGKQLRSASFIAALVILNPRATMPLAKVGVTPMAAQKQVELK
jgi:hypothetical protein